jgi:hypothetical protein
VSTIIQAYLWIGRNRSITRIKACHNPDIAIFEGATQENFKLGKKKRRFGRSGK